MKVLFPLRTGRGLNGREHHMARARRVQAERWAVVHAIGRTEAPAGPVVVNLWRVSPSARGLDSDNLQGAMKAIRDQVAAWLKRDDADPAITWCYHQRAGKRGEWMVGIEVLAAPHDALGELESLASGVQQGRELGRATDGASVLGDTLKIDHHINPALPSASDRPRARKVCGVNDMNGSPHVVSVRSPSSAVE